MPKCLGCGEEMSGVYLTKYGLCGSCATTGMDTSSRHKALSSGPKPIEYESPDILLTTETAPDIKITKRIDIITAECVFGMNIFRDMFAGIRDVFGGRSVATQKVLKDGRKTVLAELRNEANSVGANAVIAVRLDYSEVSGGNKSMLFVVASGTAVIAELDDRPSKEY